MFAALFSVLLISSEGATSAAGTPQVPVANEAADSDKLACLIEADQVAYPRKGRNVCGAVSRSLPA